MYGQTERGKLKHFYILQNILLSRFILNIYWPTTLWISHVCKYVHITKYVEYVNIYVYIYIFQGQSYIIIN